MKWIEIQPDVVIAKGVEADEAKGVKAVPPLTWSMREGVEYLVDHAPEFDRPASNQRAGRRIVKEFEKAGAFSSDTPTTYVGLKDEDHARLVTVTEAAEIAWGIWGFNHLDEKGNVTGRSPMDVPKSKFLQWTDAVSEALNDESYSKLMDARRAAAAVPAAVEEPPPAAAPVAVAEEDPK